ncbi:hypothetical protein [Mesorhizobium sp. ORS 3428]|uniref:hypothetical protein n=1 Tax=Mesorhizobium sp. ORS 3428 TaxID=540997 RepID=UPI0008D907C4|nr:hypothetical protein [Mesorhizobium sp. ORS 3428]OHV88805.1 hypothetical protein ORS3428_17650 [Mesorhizobium sp. ORS 3428]
MATATTTSKYDRAAIVRAAWADYNRHYEGRPWLKRSFSRADFSFYLAAVWRRAKLETVAAPIRRQIEISHEIEALAFKPFKFDTGPMRRRLEAELASALVA